MPEEVFPTNSQELFEFAIAQARSVNGEFGNFRDNIRLYAWAESYAKANSLTLPDLEAFGIYYELEDDDADFLEECRRTLSAGAKST